METIDYFIISLKILCFFKTKFHNVYQEPKINKNVNNIDNNIFLIIIKKIQNNKNNIFRFITKL